MDRADSASAEGTEARKIEREGRGKRKEGRKEGRERERERDRSVVSCVDLQRTEVGKVEIRTSYTGID